MEPGDLDSRTFFNTLDMLTSMDSDDETLENMRHNKRQKRERASESSQWLKWNNPDQLARVTTQAGKLRADLMASQRSTLRNSKSIRETSIPRHIYCTTEDMTLSHLHTQSFDSRHLPRIPSPSFGLEGAFQRSPCLDKKIVLVNPSTEEREALLQNPEVEQERQSRWDRADDHTRSFSQATTASHISTDGSQNLAPAVFASERAATAVQGQKKKDRARSPSPTYHRTSKRRITARPVPELSRGTTEPAKAPDNHAEERPRRLQRFATAGEVDTEKLSRPQLHTKVIPEAKRTSYQSARPKKQKSNSRRPDPRKQFAPLRSSLLSEHVLFYLPRSKDGEQSKRKLTAMAHGAEVVDILDSKVTHIVADGDYRRDWNLERLQVHLKGLTVPPKVQFVDVWYIPDCVRSGKVLDIKEGVARRFLSKDKNQHLLGRNSSLGYRVPGCQQFLEALRKNVETERGKRADLYEAPNFVSDLPSHSESTTPLEEVPDSQPSPFRTPRKASSMPPPESPASLQLKPDSRQLPSSPKLARLSSEHIGDLDSFFVKKQAKLSIVIPTTPRRRGTNRQKQREEIDDPEETPEKRYDTPYSFSSVWEAPTRSIQGNPLRGYQGTKRRRDELDEMVEKATKREIGSELEDKESDSDESQEVRQFKRAKNSNLTRLSSSWQQTFACMHGGKAEHSAGGPNAFIIEKLQEMADYYERTREPWKGPAYRKAINALKRTNEAITTRAAAYRIPGIGDRLAKNIEEIAQTKSLRRLEEAKSNKSDHVLQIFLQVYGAGLTVARDWMKQGFQTLDDLRTKAKLSKNQQIGLDHYDDFLARIPRSEVANHEALVKSTLVEISADLEVTVGGSYRRRSDTCGDIDFLITSKTDFTNENTLRMIIFEELLPRLNDIGYLRCSLATSSSDGGSKWHGAAALPGETIWRRVDFLMVPWKEWGAALIYFTGNDIFNRSMRLLASKKGMRLNQRGLYTDVLRGPNRTKLTDGKLLEGRDERKIFEILGVPYRLPEERVI